jgi:hypothetical protein
VYALLVFYSSFTTLDICNCCNPPFLPFIILLLTRTLLIYTLYSCLLVLYSFILLLYSYFTRTFLALSLSLCGFTGLLECVQQSEGLRRDGACEHGVFQQRAAGAAPLHEPPHVCLLMHAGAVQASTRFQIGPRVRPAVHWGHFNPVQHVSTVPQVKCRVLGR